MKFRILVLAKQVPDTRNVGKDAMKADGTVNRGALPAIFNPEDLNALEMALKVKDQMKDAEVIVISMGPSRASGIIREALYRGADMGYLITDRKFAGSDTLATSYVLTQTIKQFEPYHLVFAGRQAIDGDTAQVGPQVAEKLSIPQITYAETIKKVTQKTIEVQRRLERGVETVRSHMPVVITVHSSAPECRPREAKKIMKFKHARTVTELQNEDKDYTDLFEQRPYLTISEWGVSDIDSDENRLGLNGSPTKVKKIENIVFTQKESKVLAADDESLDELMRELIDSHVIG